MSWKDYADAQLRGIEETDRLSEDLWGRALAAIIVAEVLLRDRVRRRLLVIPLTADGHFDTRADRRSVVRFRQEVAAATRDFRVHLSRAITGRAPTPSLVPSVATEIPATGIASRAMQDAIERADRAYRRSRRILAQDRARAAQRAAQRPGEPPPPLDDFLPPGDDLPPPPEPPSRPADAAPPPAVAMPRDEDRARDEDAADAVTDLLMNVWGNAGNEARRFAEQMLGLVTRFGKRSRALDHLDAERPDGPPGSKGWRANRNILRRSVVEHIRAMHRRRTITNAVRDGIAHFRLDVPANRFGKVAPDGALGRQLWRVRTLSDWEAVQARENNTRNASSDFAGLGFGFGDMSYVVPVPPEYLREAAQQGRAWRERHMGAKVR